MLFNHVAECELLKLFHSLLTPRLIKLKFMSHEFGDFGSHFRCGFGIQKQGARAACKHVFNRSCHFEACCPDDLRGMVSQLRVQPLAQRSILAHHFPDC